MIRIHKHISIIYQVYLFVTQQRRVPETEKLNLVFEIVNRRASSTPH